MSEVEQIPENKDNNQDQLQENQIEDSLVIQQKQNNENMDNQDNVEDDKLDNNNQNKEENEQNMKIRNFFNKKQNYQQQKKAQIAIQQDQQQLRVNFQNQLNKLTNQDTRENAMQQLKLIIQENNTTQSLRVYINVLCEGQKNWEIGAQECELLLIAYICAVYGTNLIDPIDKPPSFETTVLRIIESIHKYFAESNKTVQQACSRSLKDVYKFCMKEMYYETVIMLLFDPLFSLLQGGAGRYQQQAACLCISELIMYMKIQDQKSILIKISNKVLNGFLKVNSEFFEILSAINSMIDLLQAVFIPVTKLSIFMQKLIQFLEKSQKSPQSTIISKIECCQLIGRITEIYDWEGILENLDYSKIIQTLEISAKERNVPVQKAAQLAIQKWSAMIFKDDPKLNQYSEIEKNLQKKNQAKPFGQKNNNLNNFKQLREKFKQQKQQIANNQVENQKQMLEQDKFEENQSQKFMNEDIFELVKGKGFGARARGQQYVKRGTGSGGGMNQQGLPQSQLDKVHQKSHEKKLKDLKKMIYQGVQKSQKNLDENDFNNFNENSSDMQQIKSQLEKQLEQDKIKAKSSQNFRVNRPQTGNNIKKNNNNNNIKLPQINNTNNNQTQQEEPQNYKYESTKLLNQQMDQIEQQFQKKQQLEQLNKKVKQENEKEELKKKIEDLESQQLLFQKQKNYQEFQFQQQQQKLQEILNEKSNKENENQQKLQQELQNLNKKLEEQQIQYELNLKKYQQQFEKQQMQQKQQKTIEAQNQQQFQQENQINEQNIQQQNNVQSLQNQQQQQFQDIQQDISNVNNNNNQIIPPQQIFDNEIIESKEGLSTINEEKGSFQQSNQKTDQSQKQIKNNDNEQELDQIYEKMSKHLSKKEISLQDQEIGQQDQSLENKGSFPKSPDIELLINQNEQYQKFNRFSSIQEPQQVTDIDEDIQEESKSQNTFLLHSGFNTDKIQEQAQKLVQNQMQENLRASFATVKSMNEESLSTNQFNKQINQVNTEQKMKKLINQQMDNLFQQQQQNNNNNNNNDKVNNENNNNKNNSPQQNQIQQIIQQEIDKYFKQKFEQEFKQQIQLIENQNKNLNQDQDQDLGQDSFQKSKNVNFDVDFEQQHRSFGIQDRIQKNFLKNQIQDDSNEVSSQYASPKFPSEYQNQQQPKQKQNKKNKQEFKIQQSQQKQNKLIDSEIYAQKDSLIYSPENSNLQNNNQQNQYQQIQNIQQQNQLFQKQQNKQKQQQQFVNSININQNQFQNGDQVSQNQNKKINVWQSALLSLQNSNIQEAYNQILTQEDDMQLVRLISKTGPCLKNLDDQHKKQMLQRINNAYHNNIMQNLGLQIFQTCVEDGLIEHLPFSTNKDILQNLFDMSSSSNPGIGTRSAELFAQIEASLNSQQYNQ